MTTATATYNCKCCGKPFTARTADRARGWARFCSKSCKAIKQEARTGQHRAHQERRQESREYGFPLNMSPDQMAYMVEGPEWDAHKDS